MPQPAAASPDPVLVRFAGVRKSYDGRTLVVSDLDLEVRRGEFLTLLGPSGSGKTTTLMMLAGFETPSAGRIELDGRPLDALPPWRRDIGMVFQSYALFPHLSVAENIAFPLRRRRRSAGEIARRVQAMLALVQLEGLGERRPAQLSGGQQQRVALARALVFEPALVLMDEPLGALDKQLREQMQLELKRLHARLGVTIVYVTHDQAEALTMSDRIAVFAGGRIRQLASPVELYEHPADAFVAEFVGENNRLDGTVTTVDGPACAVRLADGLEVRATAVGRVEPGAAVILSLRPERVAIDPAGDPGRYENRASGEVTEAVYLGDHARLELRLAQGTPLVAKVANAAFARRPGPGQPVSLAWRAADCRAFVPEPTGAR